jgi:hypothetical protein
VSNNGYGCIRPKPDHEGRGIFPQHCLVVTPARGLCLPNRARDHPACRYWQSKGCDGLVAQASIALANKLQGEINSGRVLAYEMRRNSKLELVPNEAAIFSRALVGVSPPRNAALAMSELASATSVTAKGTSDPRPPNTRSPLRTFRDSSHSCAGAAGSASTERSPSR